MRTDIPQPVRLTDYRPPAFLVDEVDLTFRLAPAATRVVSRLSLRRNPQAPDGGPLRLDGVELKLVAIALDGRPLGPDEYAQDDEGLVVFAAPDAGVLETEVEIDPAANTALEGLYISAGRFCTQ